MFKILINDESLNESIVLYIKGTKENAYNVFKRLTPHFDDVEFSAISDEFEDDVYDFIHNSIE